MSHVAHRCSKSSRQIRARAKHTQTHLHTHTHTNLHTHTHTHIHTHTHTQIHTHSRTRTRTHKRTHTNTHTKLHTLISRKYPCTAKLQQHTLHLLSPLVFIAMHLVVLAVAVMPCRFRQSSVEAVYMVEIAWNPPRARIHGQARP